MKPFDNSQLRADEIAFNIVTNRAVGAGRFSDFLDSLLLQSARGAFPTFNLEIDELAKGSIFGRLRVVVTEPVNTSQIERLEAELNRLRDRLDSVDAEGLDLLKRQTIAAESAASSSKIQAGAAEKSLHYLQITTALTAATLLATLASCSQDENPNSCSIAIAELMERDDVAAVQFWSRTCSYTATKQNSPEFLRREQAENAILTKEVIDAKTRTWTDGNGVLRNDDITSSYGSGAFGSGPLGSSPVASGPVGPERSASVRGTTTPPFPIAAEQRPGDVVAVSGRRAGNQVPMAPTIGTISFEGDTVLFRPTSADETGQAMIMAPAPLRIFVNPANRYMVRGTLIKTGANRDIIMPDLITVAEVDGG